MAANCTGSGRYKCFSNRRLNSRFVLSSCAAVLKKKQMRIRMEEEGTPSYFYLFTYPPALLGFLGRVILLGQFVLPHSEEEGMAMAEEFYQQTLWWVLLYCLGSLAGWLAGLINGLSWARQWQWQWNETKLQAIFSLVPDSPLTQETGEAFWWG